MTMKTISRLGFGALALTGTLSCGGGEDDGGVLEPEADPGFVNVNLTTPNTTDGALLLTVSGGTLDSLDAPGLRLFTSVTNASSATLLVAGDISAGTVARFWVPDRANVDVGLYRAVLQQAAARTTYEQLDVSSYSMTVSR